MFAAEVGAVKAGHVPSLNNPELDPEALAYQLEDPPR
jgi:hypothetical protein